MLMPNNRLTRVEVLTDVASRRYWLQQKKLRIVAYLQPNSMRTAFEIAKADGVEGSRSPASQCAILQVSESAIERSYPMQVTTVGLGLAKTIFHVHGVTEEEQVGSKPTSVTTQHSF